MECENAVCKNWKVCIYSGGTAFGKVASKSEKNHRVSHQTIHFTYLRMPILMESGCISNLQNTCMFSTFGKLTYSINPAGCDLSTPEGADGCVFVGGMNLAELAAT